MALAIGAGQNPRNKPANTKELLAPVQQRRSGGGAHKHNETHRVHFVGAASFITLLINWTNWRVYGRRSVRPSLIVIAARIDGPIGFAQPK